MGLRMFIMGVVGSTVLLIVMVLTRLMVVTSDDPEFTLTEIETVTLAPPPEPEIIEESEPEEVSETVPPPAVELDLSPSLEIPVIVASDVVIEPDVEFEMMVEDVEVAALPVAPKKVVKVDRPKPRPTSRPTRRSAPKPKVTAPTAVKSSYSVGELDRAPSNIRTGSFVWPRGVRDSSVSARVDVEIDERGRVRVLSIRSLSNPQMRSVVMRVVGGSRFTAPKVKGRAVKLRYTWPLTLQKPR